VSSIDEPDTSTIEATAMRAPRMTIGRWMIAVAIIAGVVWAAILFQRSRVVVYDPLWRPSGTFQPTS
jgi:hypothetical protein